MASSSALYPLILLMNRDEYHNRPTAPLAWWEGGRDRFADGTWLACSRNGRLAFVTNVREVHKSTSLAKNGRELPVSFAENNLQGFKTPVASYSPLLYCARSDMHALRPPIHLHTEHFSLLQMRGIQFSRKRFGNEMFGHQVFLFPHYRICSILFSPSEYHFLLIRNPFFINFMVKNSIGFQGDALRSFLKFEVKLQLISLLGFMIATEVLN